MILNNIKGYLTSRLNFQEKILSEKQKQIIASGLLLPKDKVSRNGVVYDWDSVKNTYEQVKGLKLMYNHETDGIDAVPIGHATDVWLKEEDDDEGIAGLYYQADLDPEHPQTRKILRGDLDNVSLQVNAEKVVPEFKDGEEYQRAFINDWIEFSVVPTPGMKDATIEARIAEAYKIEKLDKILKENSKFPEIAFKKGLIDEMKEHPSFNSIDAAQIVIDHLKKDNDYYSQNSDSEESKTEDINTSTAAGAIAPTMSVEVKDKEESKMSNPKIKKEETPIDNPEDEKKKIEQVKDEEEKEETDDVSKPDMIKKEEYDNDMGSVTDVLEALNQKVQTLQEDMDNLKGQDTKIESALKDTEADKKENEETPSDKEEEKDKVIVEQNEDGEEDVEINIDADGDKDVDVDKDEDEDKEPIPPITEKRKTIGLKNSIRKENIKKEMTFNEAVRGFTKDSLKLI